MNEQIQRWFEENRGRLVVFFGVLFVGVLCFQAGLLQGRMRQTTPLVIAIPDSPEPIGVATPSVPVAVQGKNPIGEPVVAIQTTSPCLFVGSKNSNKYHLSTCAVAKRIKPENRICFTNKEEAERRGYVPSCVE